MLFRRRLGIIFLIALAAISLFVWGPLLFKRPFLRIPIVFSEGKSCIWTNIEGEKYLLELDSGSTGYFSLDQEVMDKIKGKRKSKNRTWVDINGNNYESEAFSVDKINIESFELSNPIAFVENVEFIEKGCKLKSSISNENIVNQSDKIQGRIGLKALRLLDYWLVDFPNSALFAIRDIETICNKPGFSFKGFTKVPLEELDGQVVISVETDFGMMKLELDTGAGISVLNLSQEKLSNHQIVHSEHLVIGDRDFGKTDFYVFEMPNHFEIDGILGRDFFANHAVYIDFKNNRVLIR